MNVKSLYTNIPNAEVSSAVKAALESYPKKYVVHMLSIVLLALILILYNLMFNCKKY